MYFDSYFDKKYMYNVYNEEDHLFSGDIFGLNLWLLENFKATELSGTIKSGIFLKLEENLFLLFTDGGMSLHDSR